MHRGLSDWRTDCLEIGAEWPCTPVSGQTSRDAQPSPPGRAPRLGQGGAGFGQCLAQVGDLALQARGFCLGKALSLSSFFRPLALRAYPLMRLTKLASHQVSRGSPMASRTNCSTLMSRIALRPASTIGMRFVALALDIEVSTSRLPSFLSR